MEPSRLYAQPASVAERNWREQRTRLPARAVKTELVNRWRAEVGRGLFYEPTEASVDGQLTYDDYRSPLGAGVAMWYIDEVMDSTEFNDWFEEYSFGLVDLWDYVNTEIERRIDAALYHEAIEAGLGEL